MGINSITIALIYLSLVVGIGICLLVMRTLLVRAPHCGSRALEAIAQTLAADRCK